MAKKKVSRSHQEKPLPKQEDFVKAHQEVTPSMDSDASEKLQSLKSLNQMLLKEAFERRQQVESLVQSKGSLEMELTQSNSEREALKSELTRLGERAVRLELERSVVAVFVAAQVGLKREVIERKMKGLEMEMKELKRVIDEKEREIGRLNGKLSETEVSLGNEREVSRRVCVERDEVRDKLDQQLEEGKGLRANLIEFEERKRAIEREIGELRVAYDAVVREKEEREMRIELITREKDSIERSLVESNKLIDEMKEELHGVVREKEGVEKEKNVEMVKSQELENAVNGLNEMVVNLQKEEVKLHAIVAELEKKCFEGEERQKQMGREIDQLVEERKLSEKRIDGLADEKTAIEKDFSEALNQLAEQKHKIEEMVNENIVILEAKVRLDSEVGALQNQVDELKAVVLRLEESSRVEVEKIKSLESEVGDYRCKLEQVKIERDEMENCLDEEKQNAVRLKEKIEELENKILESLKASGKVKAENAAISAEKVELESQCEMLKKEIISLENTITEARNELDSMNGKVELADANSHLVLNMLKDTAAFCSKDESDVGVGDLLRNGEETKAYVMELEMIKNAFKSKATKVENMKRQLEFLQISVEDAHKKKSFWTVLSSATTLLAAVSLAYVARGH
ncbi:hypothetical protein Pfo_025626 [Paulownia fortunei]|nr:hypothetical protein Pfo_025626 [Paulownia fortunei]